jgi:hypothetical protein
LNTPVHIKRKSSTNRAAGPLVRIKNNSRQFLDLIGGSETIPDHQSSRSRHQPITHDPMTPFAVESSVNMNKLAIALLLAAALVGCNKKTAPTSGDPVDQKLQELAGSGATDCGRVKSVAPDQAKPASECAVQAAQAKKPFYVAYDMPGLTVGIAGSSEGKLYALQSEVPQPAEGQQSASQPAQLTVTPCPSELRIASSGRVTCYPMGSFGAVGGAMGGASPHGGGMMMPPAGAENPHGGGMMMPPAGTPNPHGSMTMPSTHGSATKNEQPGSKDASKQ